MASGASLSTHLHPESAADSTLALCQPQCPQPHRLDHSVVFRLMNMKLTGWGQVEFLPIEPEHGVIKSSQTISPAENATASYVR